MRALKQVLSVLLRNTTRYFGGIYASITLSLLLKSQTEIRLLDFILIQLGVQDCVIIFSPAWIILLVYLKSSLASGLSQSVALRLYTLESYIANSVIYRFYSNAFVDFSISLYFKSPSLPLFDCCVFSLTPFSQPSGTADSLFNVALFCLCSTPIQIFCVR